MTSNSSSLKHLFFHSVSGSGIWEELSGWFQLKVSHEVVVSLSPETAVIWSLQIHSKIIEGCWQETSIPHHMDFSIGYLSVPLHSSWLPPAIRRPPRVNDSRKGEPKTEAEVYYNLISDVTLYLFAVFHRDQYLVQCGRGLHKGVSTRR